MRYGGSGATRCGSKGTVVQGDFLGIMVVV